MGDAVVLPAISATAAHRVLLSAGGNCSGIYTKLLVKVNLAPGG